MALLARNADQLVLRAIEQALVVTCPVTMQTARRVLRRLALEAPYEFFGRFCFLRISGGRHHCVSVRFSWAVAALATCPELRVRGIAAGMNGLLKLRRFVLMTRRAYFDSGVVLGLCVSRCSPCNRWALRCSRLLLT